MSWHQYIHITFLPHDATYFSKWTRLSCNKAPPQHDAATAMPHWMVDISLESKIFVPVCSCKLKFGCYRASSLLNHVRLCRYRTCFNLDNCWCLNLCTDVYTDEVWGSEVDFFWFPTKLEGRPYNTPTDTPSTDIYPYLWCSSGWTRLIKIHDFFQLSCDFKQRGTKCQGRPWNTSTGRPPIDSNDVN